MLKVFFSLRSRVLLLIAIPFAVMLGMTVYRSLDEREERLADARERVLNTVRLMAAEQRRIIERAHQILLSVALLPELRRGIAPDACGRVLSQKVGESAVFVNMLVALPDGNAICNATAAAQPVNIADRDFFQRALQTHEFVVGGYIISRSTGKPAIGIAYPLLDEAGRPELVVSATLDLGWLEREIARFDLPEGSHAVVLGGQGTILARYPDTEGWAGKPAPANMPLVKTVLGSGAEGTADDLGLDGVRRIFAFMPLHKATTGQVYLWVGIPKGAVVGPPEREFVRTVLIAFALLVLTFGAFWLGSERLFLGRIAALGEAAARLGKGEFATRAGLQPGSDEIAQLAQSFDRMAGALETKEQQLARANRALRVISAGNRTMLRAKSEQQLVEDLCRAVVETGGYRIAWVGYAENDAGKTIRPVARWGTVAEGFFENVKLTWSETGNERTPPGDAIHSGTPVVIQDIQKEAGREPWRQNALRSGCGSCIALPLRIGDSVIGVLDICAEKPGAFDDEELGLLSEAAADLSYGIAALRGVTELPPIKVALRTAEARFRAAAEASLDALFILKSVRDRKNNIVDFEFTDMNKRAEQMLGMARDKGIGQKLCELLPVIRTGGFFDKYAQVVNTGSFLEEEFPIDTPEIKARWLRHQVVRVDDGIAISSRDVTPWKEAGAAFRKLSQQNALILKSTGEGIYGLDTEGRITFMNPAGAAILQWKAQELIGRDSHVLFHHSEADGTPYPPEECPIRTAYEDGAIHRVADEVFWKKDGTSFAVEYVSTPIRDEDGKLVGAVVIFDDISERKRTEQALSESEERLSAIFESVQDGILLANAETRRLRAANAAICRMLGYSLDELLKLGVEDIHPKEDIPNITREFEQQLKGEIGVAPNLPVKRKDGTVFYADINSAPLTLGGETCLVGVFRDITERRQAERALERANRALRTLGACNEALVRAGNEAELLDSVCRLIVETGGYRMAWVGFPEQDPAKTVRPLAKYGHEEGYLAVAKISWADTERGRDPTGTAIRTETVQINQNFLTTPALAPWREAARERGYQSGIALPLKSSASALGALTIYAPEPDAFNEDEVTLLQELAEDLAFGIQTLRTRAERDRIAYEHQHHAEILRQSLEDSIKAIADTVEMRDPYTAGHQRRVGKLAVAISRELGLPEETIRGIELAASVHDLGKINVPAEILAKPSRLTNVELMLVKNHAQAGYDILKGIKFPWPIATMVLQHHERLDGSGYPQGLKDGEILLESRIMAVADVVEAMASHRPYRAALGIDVALKETERGRGTAYDAAVVDACTRLFAEKRFTFSA